MPALAGQNRARADDAGSIERTAVILLTIAVVIVAAPARTLRQVTLEQAIHDRDGIAHDGIVRRTNAQAHQVKEIAPDNVPGGMRATAIGNSEHCRVRVSVGIGPLRIGGIDSNVVATEPFD
jgi:hypothetical protein